jgi:hypothetical protein
MSLLLATLLPGLFLALLGGLLVWNDPRVERAAKALPRSQPAAWVLFGAGAVWFVWRLSRVGESDLILVQTPGPLMIAFGALAVLAFVYTPDFLAVRGLSVLMLLVAEHLLKAGFMNFQWQVYPYKIAVYIGLALALYLAAVPYRLRDFFAWLYRAPTRPRLLGAGVLVYGLVTSAAAFTY